MQAALDILTRRKQVIPRAEYNAAIDLKDMDLRKAWLRGANLGYTYLGRTLLNEADLEYAKLDHLGLEETSFRNANLQNVSFEHVNWFGPIYVDGAAMAGARVRQEDWHGWCRGTPKTAPTFCD